MASPSRGRRADLSPVQRRAVPPLPDQRSGSLPFYNVTVLTQPDDVPSLRLSLPTQTFHHPVDPAWLHPGTNDLALTVEAMPGNEVVHALSLRRIRIVASWEERD